MQKALEILPLETLQHWMQTVLVNPSGEILPPSLLPESLRDDVEKVVSPSSRLTGAQRLAIYRRSYLARLRECMGAQFRALKYALGEELFTAFADEYLQLYPSESYTLADLGKRFPAFLEETRPDKDLPPNEREDWPDFMIELARLEMELLAVFDYPDINNYVYANKDTPDNELQLAPVLFLHAFRFPVNRYFHAVQRGDNPQLPHEQQSFIAIARKNYQVGMFGLNPMQYQFLLSLQQQPGLIAEVITRFAGENSIGEIKIKELWSTWRPEWLENGFFVKC